MGCYGGRVEEREHKIVTVPKVRVEADRAEKYRRALRRRQQANPDLKFSDWCREAFDALADRDLGKR